MSALDALSVRQLEVFRTLLAEGSATATARRLGISQPAVSRTLDSLETLLGTVLFERRRGALRPTSTALAIRPQLDALFRQFEALKQSLHPLAENELRIAATPTYCAGFAQQVIASYLDHHPHISVRLDTRHSSTLHDMLLSGDLHVGISDSLGHAPEVQIEPFVRSSAVCVMPEHHPLAARAVIRAEHLAGIPLVQLPREHESRRLLDQRFAEARIPRRGDRLEVNTTFSALVAVRAGCGVAVMNAFPLLDNVLDGVVARPFHPAISYQTSFILRRDHIAYAPARDFIRHARLLVRQHPPRYGTMELASSSP